MAEGQQTSEDFYHNERRIIRAKGVRWVEQHPNSKPDPNWQRVWVAPELRTREERWIWFWVELKYKMLWPFRKLRDWISPPKPFDYFSQWRFKIPKE